MLNSVLAAALALQATEAPRPSALGAQLRAQVEREHYYPERSYRAGQTGIVEIRFELDRDGLPSGSRITRSSGWPLLDQAALRAIARFRPVIGAAVGQQVTLLLQYDIARQPGAPEARSAMDDAIEDVRRSRGSSLAETVRAGPR